MTLPVIVNPLFSYPAAPGGNLYTYEAGGVTDKTTYSDAAGASPNANPVVLDSNGNATIRGSGSYHLLLKDSTNTNTLFDVDDVTIGTAESSYAADTGSVNALAIANTFVDPALNARALVKIGHTNTSTSVTLACNGGSAYTVLMNNGLAPSVGQLIAGQVADMVYNGTDWIVLNLWPIIEGSGEATIPYALTVDGGAATPVNDIGNSSTAFTLDCSKSNVQTLKMTGNVASGGWTISNPADGQTVNLFITQDATGSRTLGWPTSFKWAGGSAGTISSAAGAVDLLVMTYRSATTYWYVSLLNGFA